MHYIQKYKQIRSNTRELLEEEHLRATMRRIDVLPIDHTALDAVDAWPQELRLAPFDWRAIMRTVQKSHPRAFHMAIWVDKSLCGLSVARLSNAKEWVSITHIEGSPLAQHPLKGKVAALTIAAADIYTAQVQVHDAENRLPAIRILRPLAKVIDWYDALGYSDVATAKAAGRVYHYVQFGQGESS